jgi:hypothetical protein
VSIPFKAPLRKAVAPAEPAPQFQDRPFAPAPPAARRETNVPNVPIVPIVRRAPSSFRIFPQRAEPEPSLPINADPVLETEAEAMGAKVSGLEPSPRGETPAPPSFHRIPAAGPAAPVQGAFLYSFLRNQIEGSRQPDDYYESLPGFVRALSADGHWVWTDQRNVHLVSQSFVSPQIVANYAPTAPPPGVDEDEDQPDEEEMVEELDGIVHGLAEVADQVEALLPSAPLPLPSNNNNASASSASAPATRLVKMAVLQVPTHDKGWQAATSLVNRLGILETAVKAALEVWAEESPGTLCVLTAPEYFFALQSDQSHFMAERDHGRLLAEVDRIASRLPANVLFIPGTIGWSQRVGDLAPPQDSKSESPSASEAPNPAAEKLLQLTEQLQKRHQEITAVYGEDFTEGLASEWEFEADQAAKFPPAEVNLVFNSAYVFFQNTMARYDKIFESTVRGASDRLGDKGSLFMHGTEAFSNVYMGVRVSLEICSDYASEASKALAAAPALQIVTASYFGGGGGLIRGQHVLMADSTSPGSFDAEQEPVAENAVDLGKNVRLIFSQTTLPTSG